MIKDLKKIGIEAQFLNMINYVWQTNKSIRPNIRNKTRIPLLPLLLNIVLTFVRAIWQEKEIKGVHIEKEEIKLFVDDMILDMQDPKNSTKKCLELITIFNKVWYKINTLVFVQTDTERSERKLWKLYHNSWFRKNDISRN